MPGLEPKANLSKKQKVLRDISGEKEAMRNWRPLDCSEPSSNCLYPVIYFCCANADCLKSKAHSCRRRTDGSWLLVQWGVFQAHTLRGAQEDWRKVRGFLRHLACISDQTQTKDNVSKSPNRLRDLQSAARVFFSNYITVFWRWYCRSLNFPRPRAWYLKLRELRENCVIIT